VTIIETKDEFILMGQVIRTSITNTTHSRHEIALCNYYNMLGE